MSEDLNILPPSLKLCEPVDSSDIHYLNQSHTPIVNPLKKALNIELHIEEWFSKPPATSPLPFLYDHATFSFPSETTSPFPTLVKLHEDTHTFALTPLLDDSTDIDSSPPLPSSLHRIILRSDGLILIQYTPEDTLKSRWFLVQINHDEILALQMKPETTGDYLVNFLSRHLCDNNTRWWPL